MADQDPDESLEEKRNRYERKLDAKRERLLARADKAEREGDARIKRANDDASVIPLGQPILVGHHSEKRDRNFRKRINTNFTKGHELKQKASRLRQRAAGVGTAGISSDDPDAVVKLSEKLEELEKKQQLYKAINKALRKADRTGSDEEAEEAGDQRQDHRRAEDSRLRRLSRHPLLRSLEQQLEHAPDPPADRGAQNFRGRPDERRGPR